MLRCQGFGYDDYRVYGKACAAHNIDRTYVYMLIIDCCVAYMGKCRLQVNITAGILPNWAERVSILVSNLF